jgi:hypothetical protein
MIVYTEVGNNRGQVWDDKDEKDGDGWYHLKLSTLTAPMYGVTKDAAELEEAKQLRAWVM